MKSKSQASSKRTSSSKGGGDEGTSSQSKGEPNLGSLIWIKFNGNSWWPAQVVDENRVSKSSKPDGRSPGDVLVRLYGSYQYYYVDPIKCLSEFETVLQQNNGSYQDIFWRALELDVPTSKSGRSKGGGSKGKAGAANTSSSASKDVMSNRRLTKGNQDLEDTTVRQATVATPESKTKNKGKTPRKDKHDGTSNELGIIGTSEFLQESISHRLKSCSRTAAKKAKVRISRQVQTNSEHDGLQKEHLPRKGQISDENDHKGTADSDNEKKKLRSRKERLRDKLPEQDRTMKSDSKKLKLSSAKEEGKSEVPKLEESVKKQKPAPTPVVKPKKLSMRRFRVMKTLGLISPSEERKHVPILQQVK